MSAPAVTYTFSNSTAADATQVNQNFTDLINGMTDGTRDFSIAALTLAGAFNAQAAVTLGSSTSNDLTVNAALASSIAIKTTFSYDIGSATLGLRYIFLGSNDSAARSVKLSAGAVTASYTLTLPIAVAAANNSVIEYTTGGVGAFRALKVPTIQTFTSGSGTYTTPSGVKYIRVRMVGGGGGGAGSGTSSGTAAGGGGNTTFGTTLLVANGGNGGGWATSGTLGGSASLGAASGIAYDGSRGSPGSGGPGGGSTFFYSGGDGGTSPFGGQGCGGWAGVAGTAGVTNTGSGGGGGGSSTTSANTYSGAGGGAGGFVDAIITSPSASYSYAVGAAGTAGGAGPSGFAGAAGGSGFIIVEEFYQ